MFCQDPTATLAAPNSSPLDPGFSPYQSNSFEPHVVLPKNQQLQVVRIRGLGYLRSLWQVDRSRLRNVTNSCTTASQLSADWIRLIRFQMMPQLSIMRAIQVREPKRLKQATGHVQVDRVHGCLAVSE